MASYRVWHYLCRETVKVMRAVSSFDARREMARELGVGVADIVAVRYDR
jgi:hypothetical protein